jgi:hypothetical protein
MSQEPLSAAKTPESDIEKSVDAFSAFALPAAAVGCLLSLQIRNLFSPHYQPIITALTVLSLPLIADCLGNPPLPWTPAAKKHSVAGFFGGFMLGASLTLDWRHLQSHVSLSAAPTLAP